MVFINEIHASNISEWLLVSNLVTTFPIRLGDIIHFHRRRTVGQLIGMLKQHYKIQPGTMVSGLLDLAENVAGNISVDYVHVGIISKIEQNGDGTKHVLIIHLSDLGGIPKIQEDNLLDVALDDYCRIDNSFDDKWMPRCPAEKIVAKAREMIGKPIDYHVLKNNCEKLALSFRYEEEMMNEEFKYGEQAYIVSQIISLLKDVCLTISTKNPANIATNEFMSRLFELIDQYNNFYKKCYNQSNTPLQQNVDFGNNSTNQNGSQNNDSSATRYNYGTESNSNSSRRINAFGFGPTQRRRNVYGRLAEHQQQQQKGGITSLNYNPNFGFPRLNSNELQLSPFCEFGSGNTLRSPNFNDYGNSSHLFAGGNSFTANGMNALSNMGVASINAAGKYYGQCRQFEAMERMHAKNVESEKEENNAERAHLIEMNKQSNEHERLLQNDRDSAAENRLKLTQAHEEKMSRLNAEMDVKLKEKIGELEKQKYQHEDNITDKKQEYELKLREWEYKMKKLDVELELEKCKIVNNNINPPNGNNNAQGNWNHQPHNFGQYSKFPSENYHFPGDLSTSISSGPKQQNQQMNLGQHFPLNRPPWDQDQINSASSSSSVPIHHCPSPSQNGPPHLPPANWDNSSFFGHGNHRNL